MGMTAASTSAWAATQLDICDALGLSGLTVPSSPTVNVAPEPKALTITKGPKFSFDYGCYIQGDFAGVIPGTVTVGTPDDLNGGFGIGGSFGVPVGQTDFGVVHATIKLMDETSTFTSNPDASMNAFSVMLDPTLTQEIAPKLAVYEEGGVGLIFLDENYPGGGNGWGAGFNMGGGVLYELSHNVSFGVGADYQNIFGTIDMSKGPDAQLGSFRVTTNLRYTFTGTQGP